MTPSKKCMAPYTVYPKKYAHGFVVLRFVVAMQSFIMNSHEVFIHIHQGCFAGTGAIVRLPQCQWSKPDGYGKISQCITTTKHSKAKTVCIFLGIYCMWCNDHLCDSCGITDVNPHFLPKPLLILKATVELLLRHKYMSHTLTIGTSKWQIISKWYIWMLSYHNDV